MPLVPILLCLLLALGCAAQQQPIVSEPLFPSVEQTGRAPRVSLVGPESAAEEPQVLIATAQDALNALKDGNERFAAGRPLHPRRSKAHRAGLVSTQKPHTVILSCSDSRVPPEVLFDQGVGDLFVVRTAGEVADAAAVASIEYAVEHLGVKLLLVMGHQSCGAVKAALSVPPGKSAGSKDLDHLIAAIRPNLKGMTLAGAGDKLHGAVGLQVNGAAQALTKRSKIIREAVAHDHLSVVRGIYHLETGRVELLK